MDSYKNPWFSTPVELYYGYHELVNKFAGKNEFPPNKSKKRYDVHQFIRHLLELAEEAIGCKV